MGRHGAKDHVAMMLAPIPQNRRVLEAGKGRKETGLIVTLGRFAHLLPGRRCVTAL